MWKITDPKLATLANRHWRNCLATLAATMIALPSMAVEGIQPETHERVKQTQTKHPNFKLSDDAKRCLAGIEKDPECDQFINDEIQEFVRTRQVNERERQVNMAQEAVENIHIARALLQTVLHQEFGQVPTENDDFREKVQGYATIRPEARTLIQRYLLEPAPKNQTAWKNDLPQAMNLAKDCTNAAIGIQKKLTDVTLSKNIGAMNASFVDYYQAVKQKFSPGR